MKGTIVIGIAGGTGSGKTTITKAIGNEIGERITILSQDAYYRNFNHLTKEERKEINFDHPNSLDNDLLISHIKALKSYQPIPMPIYDFKNHCRSEGTIKKNPSKIIIVEGILIFENKELRDLMNIKIFVDTTADIRILRRIERDIKERGRTLESVISQYRQTVRPMHIEFVEPSKKFADVIIPEGGQNRIGIEMIVSQIQSILDR